MDNRPTTYVQHGHNKSDVQLVDKDKQLVPYVPKEDPVNHPSHYKMYEGFEVIDITKQLDFLYGNAVKYILRAPHKRDEVEDIKKAIWYLNKKLEEIENE